MAEFGEPGKRAETQGLDAVRSALQTDVHRVGGAAEPAEREADRLGEAIAPRTVGDIAGLDFRQIRIHSDERATRSLAAVGALTYAVGNDIVIRPHDLPERGAAVGPVLGHELAHTMLGGERGVVRRRIAPEDVSSEMIGQKMKLTGPFTSGAVKLAVDDVVTVSAWSNSSPTASVTPPGPGAPKPVDVPKQLLVPDIAATKGVAQYHSGVASTVSDLARGEAKIAAEKAHKGGPRPGEVPRLEGLQANRQKLLNRRLIQETMFNRFDAEINWWVNFYNAQFKRKDKLDPNLVKAMLFQESEMGTAGEHMSVSPPNPEITRKTRFNLGQVIDSSGPALLIMMEEMQPDLITKHHLKNLRADLAKAKPASGEAFFWTYKEAGQPTGFADAVEEFFAAPKAPRSARNMDYDFWIKTAVRWLFEKRKSVKTWEEAARAYNGSGQRARDYRDSVVKRRNAAVAADKDGTEFVPTR
jgi:hypothetical protein